MRASGAFVAIILCIAILNSASASTCKYRVTTASPVVFDGIKGVALRCNISIGKLASLNKVAQGNLTLEAGTLLKVPCSCTRRLGMVTSCKLPGELLTQDRFTFTSANISDVCGISDVELHKTNGHYVSSTSKISPNLLRKHLKSIPQDDPTVRSNKTLSRILVPCSCVNAVQRHLRSQNLIGFGHILSQPPLLSNSSKSKSSPGNRSLRLSRRGLQELTPAPPLPSVCQNLGIENSSPDPVYGQVIDVGKILFGIITESPGEVIGGLLDLMFPGPEYETAQQALIMFCEIISYVNALFNELATQVAMQQLTDNIQGLVNNINAYQTYIQYGQMQEAQAYLDDTVLGFFTNYMSSFMDLQLPQSTFPFLPHMATLHMTMLRERMYRFGDSSGVYQAFFDQYFPQYVQAAGGAYDGAINWRMNFLQTETEEHSGEYSFTTYTLKTTDGYSGNSTSCDYGNISPSQSAQEYDQCVAQSNDFQNQILIQYQNYLASALVPISLTRFLNIGVYGNGTIPPPPYWSYMASRSSLSTDAPPAGAQPFDDLQTSLASITTSTSAVVTGMDLGYNVANIPSGDGDTCSFQAPDGVQFQYQGTWGPQYGTFNPNAVQPGPHTWSKTWYSAGGGNLTALTKYPGGSLAGSTINATTSSGKVYSFYWPPTIFCSGLLAESENAAPPGDASSWTLMAPSDPALQIIAIAGQVVTVNNYFPNSVDMGDITVYYGWNGYGM